MSVVSQSYSLRPGKTIQEFLQEPHWAPHPIDNNLRFQLYAPPDPESYNRTYYWNENQNQFNQWRAASGRSVFRPSPRPLCPDVIVYPIQPITVTTLTYGTGQYRSSCQRNSVITANRPINATPQTHIYTSVIADHEVLSEAAFLEYFHHPAATAASYYSPQTKHHYGYASNDLSNLRNPNYKRRLLKKPLLF